MGKVRTSRKLASFGVWHVTRWGLECSSFSYAIERRRLSEPDWERHVSMKADASRWEPGNFARALAEARRVHGVAVARERGAA